MAQRAKKKAPKDLDKRLDSLRSDLEALQDDSKTLVSDAAGVASDTARDALRAAQALAERALRLAEDTATHARDDVEAWAQDNLDTARDKVREQPLSALAVSLGIGLLFGAIFLRL